MSPAWQYALTVGPLGFYLWVLALWQSARTPRVVRGLLDFALLALGVGGVLAFGPFGDFAVRVIAPRNGFAARCLVISALLLWGSLLARRSVRRLVVYQIEPNRLIPALSDAVGRTGGRFVRTMSGFEDVSTSRGLRVVFTRWLRCAVIEAHGLDAEGLIRDLEPPLVDRLRAETTRRTPIALGLYAASILVMLAPLIGLFLTQPHARAVLRAWLEQIRGG